MAPACIRCVSYADGGAIGVVRGLTRAVLLALLLDRQARGVHDRTVDSIVVAVSRPKSSGGR
jgi:hypothetical protein